MSGSVEMVVRFAEVNEVSDRIPGLVAALHALADQIGEEAIKPEASLT